MRVFHLPDAIVLQFCVFKCTCILYIYNIIQLFCGRCFGPFEHFVVGSTGESSARPKESMVVVIACLTELCHAAQSKGDEKESETDRKEQGQYQSCEAGGASFKKSFAAALWAGTFVQQQGVGFQKLFLHETTEARACRTTGYRHNF